jgi:hypothetical protein
MRTYHCQGVTEQDEPGRVVGQLLAQNAQIGVDFIVCF